MPFVQQWSEDGDIPSGTSYSFDISTGGGPAAGNLLIAVLALDKENPTNLAAAGFTKLDDYGGVATDVPTCAIFYKLSDGTETSVEFTWTATRDGHAWVGEYAGMHTTSPVDVKTDAEESGVVQQVPNGVDASIITTVAIVTLIAVVNADSKNQWDVDRTSWAGSDIATTRFTGYTGSSGEPQIIVGEGDKTSTGTYTTRGNTDDTGDQCCIWFGAFRLLTVPVWEQDAERIRADDGVLTEDA